MSIEPPPGYLPPHELRAIAGSLVDRDDPRPPGPSLATTSSPGLTTGAVSPAAASAPAFSADDPGSLAIALARIIGEPLTGTSLIPFPAPERVASEVGLAGIPISPGISPELSAAGSPVSGGPIEPQMMAAVPPGGASAPQPAPFGAPASAAPFDGPSPFGPPSFGGSPTGASSFGGSPTGASSFGGSPTGASSYGGSPTGASSPGGSPPSAPSHAAPHSGTGFSSAAPPPAAATQHAGSSPYPAVTTPNVAYPGAPAHGYGSQPHAVAGASPPAAQHASSPSARSSATDASVDDLQVLGDLVRVPFATAGELPVVSDLPTPGSVGALSPSMFVVPGFGGERLSLIDDARVSDAVAAPDLGRVPLFEVGEPGRSGGDSGRSGGEALRSGGGTAFDPYLVRRDFPILEERVHGGKRLVWLDNAATTQKPRAVIDRLTKFYEHENSNVHRAAHALAARATDAYESARETTRRFLNAPSANEIVFVRGATEGINLIAKSWGKRHVERGDEIVLTHLEHHANIVPWQQLCAETGARLRVAPVDDRGEVILEEYEKLLCSRTKIVAFTQVSNALGTITPARSMIESAHRWGATVVLDGAQAVSHMPVDVQALDCDFYVFSGHKVFAPTGIGAVFGKRALLEEMPPWQSGGNMIADVTFEKTVYQAPPWRFEAGTGNIADAAGLGAALEYVMRIGMSTIDRYEHELLVYATEQLKAVPGLRMVGTARDKAGVLSFVLAGKRTEDVGSALDKEGIAVRSGHHCAQPILRRFGLEASVRASLAFYNVPEDIDALVAALKRLQAASA